eukprot:1207370-Rhodomonas_salina.2
MRYTCGLGGQGVRYRRERHVLGLSSLDDIIALFGSEKVVDKEHVWRCMQPPHACVHDVIRLVRFCPTLLPSTLSSAACNGVR